MAKMASLVTSCPPFDCQQLESYFPPATLSAPGPPTTSNSASRRNGRSSNSSKHRRKTRSSYPTGASSSSTRTPADEENLQTAVILHNRDLEIYVTLPSAEKRLFVDVQEEIYIPDSTSSGSQKTKKQKVDHHNNGEVKQSIVASASTSFTSNATITSSAPSMQVDKVEESSKGKQKAVKPTSTALAPKDPNSTSSAGTSSKSAITPVSVPTIPISDQQKKKTATTSTSVQERVKKQESQPRIPYSTFEHVKLNVRVKPSSHKAKGKNENSSGVNVAALPKPAGESPQYLLFFPSLASHDSWSISLTHYIFHRFFRTSQSSRRSLTVSQFESSAVLRDLPPLQVFKILSISQFKAVPTLHHSLFSSIPGSSYHTLHHSLHWS